MKRSQLEFSAVEAATVIAEHFGQMGVLVIGSQSILGTWDDDQLPADTTASIEIDLVPLKETVDEAVSTLVDVMLGFDSDYHREHGFYVHGVGATTAYLPASWQVRLVQLVSLRSKAQVFCLDPHDTCAAKLMRFEPRDKQFVTSLVNAGLIQPSLLVERISAIEFATMERPAHTRLLAAGIHVVEHLRGLEQLPPSGSLFSAVPPKAEGFGTFPVRAYARAELRQRRLRAFATPSADGRLGRRHPRATPETRRKASRS